MIYKLSWPLMYEAFNQEDLSKVISYLKKGPSIKLTHGPEVLDFEKKWSKWLGVKYSVMVNSGASANDLSMKIIREKFGKGEVIVPPLTWVSDISSVMNSGLEPVFVDIDRMSLGMATEKIIAAVTSKTRAVFLTHVLGLNALTDLLIKELRKRKIALVEDVCESHGAVFQGKKVGTYGLISNFSFYYAHHMTTIEGGMICTNSTEIYQMARSMRSHGLMREVENENLKKKYQKQNPSLNPEFIFLYPAHNMRPTEISGILGKNQLKRLDAIIKKRNENFDLFLSLLDRKKYFTELATSGQSNYAFIVILRNPDIKLRNNVEETLRNADVEFRRGLSGGGNQLRQPYVQSRIKSINLKNFPNVEHIHSFSWYIGNYPTLPKSKIRNLVKVLNTI